MRHCATCDVDVRGDWQICPLCRRPLQAGAAPAEPNPLPDLPLRFNRNRIRRILLWASVFVIVASLALQRLLFPQQSMNALRWVWFGLASMWVVVLIIVRKRRNIAKNISYLLVVTSVLCAYADYLGGWRGWSTTIVIPVMCIFSIVGILIAVRVVRLHVGDYILYAALSALIGLAPGLFLVLGWVYNPVPSAISVAVGAIMLALALVFRRAEVKHELSKRMDL